MKDIFASIDLNPKLPSLLIVEDEPELREILASRLRGPDLWVMTAADGIEAEEILATQPMDAILSDLMMPRMGGLELLQSLRRRGVDTPFIILSAQDDHDTLMRAPRLGASYFLAKPCKLEAVDDIVSRAVELGRAMRFLDCEIDSYFLKAEATPESIEHFRRVRSALDLLRRELCRTQPAHAGVGAEE